MRRIAYRIIPASDLHYKLQRRVFGLLWVTVNTDNSYEELLSRITKTGGLLIEPRTY